MRTPFNAELMQNVDRGPIRNIFTGVDHRIVIQALAKLQGHEYKAVKLRFWENNTVSEIAQILNLSWDEAERTLVHALKKLKSMCVANPDFSRIRKSRPESEAA